ncbi:hypothetical protein FXE87_01710 [Vibrio mimicus]|nr:hypothetical protein [Vibrio cholerae]TXY30469.1 hypothetical protein FXE87_01710 [Vibrio mimicus]EGR0785168.1 hypothetical protein [Vibrio cholerae]EGR0835961.1 hypothetical protein [Vibrio cholerae]EGR0843342.1 hypothetical protein [Vibrio cholerae]
MWCWLCSFLVIIEFVYAHGDLLTCRLPITPNRLGIKKNKASNVLALNHVCVANYAFFASAAAFAMAAKPFASSDAPPTSAPSMSGCAK